MNKSANDKWLDTKNVLVSRCFCKCFVIMKVYLSELFAFFEVCFDVLNFILFFRSGAQEKGPQVRHRIDKPVANEEHLIDHLTVVSNE
jgi:hypothetical protein